MFGIFTYVLGHLGKLRDVLRRFRMFWDILGRFVMFWCCFWGCFDTFWEVFGRFGRFWDVLGCTNLGDPR